MAPVYLMFPRRANTTTSPTSPSRGTDGGKGTRGDTIYTSLAPVVVMPKAGRGKTGAERRVVIQPDGTVITIYCDSMRGTYEALGAWEAPRVSDVEYDPATGQWVATERATGRTIGRSQSRDETIAQEVAYLEGQL